MATDCVNILSNQSASRPGCYCTFRNIIGGVFTEDVADEGGCKKFLD